MQTQPISWPAYAPPYHSKAGYQFEKELTIERLRFKIKDDRAAVLAGRSGEMADIAIAALDEGLFYRYQAITLRIIEYRVNLSLRYPNGYIVA